VGLPRNPRGRRAKPKMASLYFRSPSEGSCRVTVVEPLVSYLVYGPHRYLRDGHRISVCRLRFVLLVASYIIGAPLLPPPALAGIFRPARKRHNRV